jgi:hypothetical protein
MKSASKKAEGFKNISKKEITMKKSIAVLIAVMMVVFAMGCSLPVSAYKYAVTKDIAVCDRFEAGKTTEVEVQKNLGKPVSVKKNADGKMITYRAGYMTAMSFVDGTINAIVRGRKKP